MAFAYQGVAQKREQESAPEIVDVRYLFFAVPFPAEGQ